MAKSQRRSKRKVSGGRYKNDRKKKKHELGNLPTFTKLGKNKLKTLRVKGNNRKYKLLMAEFVNVYDPKTKKHTKVKITSVTENPANRHFVRRNIITKGTIVQTEKGKVKIISRPGQEAIINGILTK